MPKAQLVCPTLGPDDRRIVPALERYGLPITVKSGDVIEGPAELIGSAPKWRKPQEGDDLDFMEVKRDDKGEIVSVHDLGSGLLAQVDVWSEPAKQSTKSGE